MISIIMPVYNIKVRKQTRAAKQCLHSIQQQTCTDWELLIADGGCTDGTMSIMHEMCKQDKRMNILPEKHYGQDAARKYAMHHIKGKYLTFIDQDDLLKKNALEIMLRAIEEDEADVVQTESVRFAFCKCFKTGKSSYESGIMDKRHVIDHDTFMEKHYQSFFGVNDLPVQVWAKLYRTEALPCECFSPSPVDGLEDLIFNMYALPYAKRISIVPDTLHYWRLGGTTSRFQPAFLKRYVTSYKLKKQQIARLHLPFEYLHTTAIELVNTGVCILKSQAAFAPSDETLRASIKHALEIPEMQEAISIVRKENKYHSALADVFLLHADDMDRMAAEIRKLAKEPLWKRLARKSFNAMQHIYDAL